MKKLFNNYVLLSISPILFYILTFNNPYYSDDYQSILGIHLLNKIKDRNFLDISDLGVLRSDGHYNPVMYAIHNLIPPDANLFHFVIVFLFLVSVYLTYFFLYKVSKNTKFAFISAFIFSVNFSLIIKPLVWNVFHSHITNYFTAIISYIFFYYFIEKKNYIFVFAFILFGALTVFNMESGLIYYIFLPLFLKYFLKTHNNFFKIISFSIIPVLIYFLFTFYLSQSSEISTIFEQRVIESKDTTVSKSEIPFKDTLIEYRSRKAPRDIIGYTLRFCENIIASINLSSYEYIYRFFDYNYEKNLYKFLIIIIFLLSSSIYFFSLFQIKIKDLSYNFRYLILLNFSILILYSILFFRKDINILLSLSSAILYSYFILFVCKKKFIKRLLIITFLMPSVLYAFTGFEEVYEMRSRAYINEMYSDFNSIKYKEYDKLNKLHYKQDAIYYYYYKFFDEYSDYLKNSYGNMSMFEFESILTEDKIIIKD